MNADEFIKDWLTQKHTIINKACQITHHLLKTTLLKFYKLKVEEDRDNESG